MEIISRKAARANKLKYYFTGKKCPHGHIAKRYVSNGTCLKCIEITYRQWSGNNKNIVKARSRKSYLKNRKKVLQRTSLWQKKNIEKEKERKIKWGKANPEKVRILKARRRSSKLRATVSWSSDKLIEAIYDEAYRLTKLTGIQHDVDHIIPLQGELVSGLHIENNLQILSRPQHSPKYNKFNPMNPTEWEIGIKP